MTHSGSFGSLSLSNRNLLNRATSASSEPTPGYIYNDVLELIKADASALNDVEDYILHKLRRSEPYIKFKCLKLLKFLCTKLPHDFTRAKISQSRVVLDCTGYRAPFSEYNGDYLSKLVRGEAEELLKVVCNDESPTKTETTCNIPSQMKDRIFGFGNQNKIGGNESLGHVPSSSGLGLQKPEGFGNYALPRTNKTPKGTRTIKYISEIVNKYVPNSIVEKIEQIGSTITTAAMEQIEKRVGFSMPGSNKGQQQFNQKFSNNASFDRFGGFDQFGSPPIKQQAESNHFPSLITSVDENTAGEVIVPGDAELKLVKEVLTFSGVKITPSQRVIGDLIAKMKYLNKDLIVGELLRQLNTRCAKWQYHLRVLCVLEALILQGTLDTSTIDHLKNNLVPMLFKCRTEAQLKNKSERILKLLGSSISDEGSDCDEYNLLPLNKEACKAESSTDFVDFDLLGDRINEIDLDTTATREDSGRPKSGHTDRSSDRESKVYKAMTKDSHKFGSIDLDLQSSDGSVYDSPGESKKLSSRGEKLNKSTIESLYDDIFEIGEPPPSREAPLRQQGGQKSCNIDNLQNDTSTDGDAFSFLDDTLRDYGSHVNAHYST